MCIITIEGFVQLKPKLPAEEDKSSDNTGGTPPDGASDKSSQHTNPILESNRYIQMMSSRCSETSVIQELHYFID